MTRYEAIFGSPDLSREETAASVKQKTKEQLANTARDRNQGRATVVLTSQVVLKEPSLPGVSAGRLGDIGIVESGRHETTKPNVPTKPTFPTTPVYTESMGRLGDIGIAESSRRPKQIANMDTSVERIEYLAAPDRKLTREEQEEARQIAGQFKADFRSRFFEKRRPEDLQRMADIAALEAKYKIGNQIGMGFAKAFGAEAIRKNASETLGSVPGMPKATDIYQSAETQNPVGFMAGQFAGEAVKYRTGAKALGAIPKVAKALQSGNVVKRIAAGNAVDLPMDIASAALNSEGDMGQFWKELGMNVGLGVGAGATSEGIGAGVRALKSSPGPRLPVMQNTAKAETKERAEELQATLRRNLHNMAFAKPVKVLSGAEFLKSDIGIVEHVGDYFRSFGNKVTRQGFSDVMVNEAGVQSSSMAFGLGRIKFAALSAVPEVIEKGRQIDYLPNWKGRGVDGYVFAAPIIMSGKRAYVTAVVTKDSKNNAYLNEVLSARRPK